MTGCSREPPVAWYSSSKSCGRFKSSWRRRLEVALDRRHLPAPADRVTRLHGDLRPVERRAARVEDELQLLRLGDLAQGLGRLLPVLVAADELDRVLGRQLQ